MQIKRLVFPIIPSMMALGLLASCASNNQPVANLGYVQFSQEQLAAQQGKINNIRYNALQSTATTLGAQGALAWRSEQIDNALQAESDDLDGIFNFQQLLINGQVLPPVIVQNDGQASIHGPDMIRTSEHTYKIIQKAQFVTTTPTWRTYLWMDFKKPDQPDSSLLPTNDAETKVWNYFLQQGWQQGLQQANDIFSTQLNRLKRDYLGMVLYRKLLSEHMVSAPFVAKADMGVTGNGQEIHIDDRVYRITKHSLLQTNPNKWSAVITK